VRQYRGFSGQLHDKKLFALWPGFLPALCQRIADFVGVLKWFHRAREACEDSGKWLALERILHLELIVSARKLPLTADRRGRIINPPFPICVTTLGGVVEIVVGAIAGAALYKESAS
jgi:hypothetical protein